MDRAVERLRRLEQLEPPITGHRPGASKVTSGPKKPANKPGAGLAALTEGPIKSCPFDDLLAELQLVGEGLIESHGRPIPPEAATEFPKIRKGIAAHGAAFEMKEEFYQEHEDEVDDNILAFPDRLDEDVDGDVPELTEEILARMFANMREHGIAV
jgi:hypothetical protein